MYAEVEPAADSVGEAVRLMGGAYIVNSDDLSKSDLGKEMRGVEWKGCPLPYYTPFTSAGMMGNVIFYRQGACGCNVPHKWQW